MNALIKRTNRIGSLFKDPNDTFFGRGIDDILKYDFFNSLDANMREDRNGYILEVAVPGMTRKDITLQVDGSMMTVAAQKQQRNDSWNIVEFNSSMFHRSFALPKNADTNAIKAKCRAGLLTIQIGKHRGSHRAVKIQAEEINKNLLGNMTSWWHGIKTRMVDFLKRKG
jgi:HSP20 family protein